MSKNVYVTVRKGVKPGRTLLNQGYDREQKDVCQDRCALT